MFGGSFLVFINLIFLLMTVYCLVVVIFDKLYGDEVIIGERDWYIQFGYEFLPIMVIIMVFRTYMIEPFTIPSESMYPTLTSGDVVVVSKSSYNLKIPFTNIGVIPTRSPDRGEVMVFKYPLDINQYYIKRIIGLPGDKIEWLMDDLYINGKKVHRQPALAKPNDTVFKGRYSFEFLGENKYRILRNSKIDSEKLSLYGSYVAQPLVGQENTFQEKSDVYTIHVPKDHYFVMGDNRDASLDSRAWGYVHKSYIVGEAKYLIMSVNKDVRIWELWNKFDFSKMGRLD